MLILQHGMWRYDFRLLSFTYSTVNLEVIARLLVWHVWFLFSYQLLVVECACMTCLRVVWCLIRHRTVCSVRCVWFKALRKSVCWGIAVIACCSFEIDACQQSYNCYIAACLQSTHTLTMFHCFRRLHVAGYTSLVCVLLSITDFLTLSVQRM